MSLHLLEIDRPDTRESIATALPEPARAALRAFLAGRAEDDCVALPEVLLVLKDFHPARAVFGNWLTYVTAGIPVRGESSSWETSLLPFPVVLLQQFLSGAGDLPDEQVQRLAKQVGLPLSDELAGRKSKAVSKESPRAGSLAEAQATLEGYTRPLKLRYQVLTAVRRAWFLRAARALGPGGDLGAGMAPVAPRNPAQDEAVLQAVRLERERCVRLCEEAAQLYPESVWPNAADEDAKGPVLARNLARRIARDIAAGG